MQLSALLEGIEYIRRIGGEAEIDALSIDSRKMRKNTLFFCLCGEWTDSHAFAEEAIKKGAVAVVGERELDISVPQVLVKDTREALARLSAAFFGYPSKRIKIVGITGTNGKTTTAYMLERVFRAGGKKAGIIGTLGVSYGDAYEESSLTTPDPIQLQATLAKMRDAGVEYAFMEVSAHALYYKKVWGVDFYACIFTNLTQDHLDFFPSMEEYREAKLALFSPERCPLAVVNGDEEAGRRILAMRGEHKTLCYGLTTPVDAFAVVTEETLKKTECVLNINDTLCFVRLSMVGRHNIYNALAAATCALTAGISVEEIAEGLSSLREVKGRLQWVAAHKGGEVYIDFAHTPDGLKKSLLALKKHCKGRLICLFGCGGNRDKSKRPIMGEIAASLCDFCVLTSDNPRYEDPMTILSGVEKGYRGVSSRYVIVPDRGRAIKYALDYMEEGDLLLLAGKGGENTQEIMGIKYPFDDQAIVKKYLTKEGEK